MYPTSRFSSVLRAGLFALGTVLAAPALAADPAEVRLRFADGDLQPEIHIQIQAEKRRGWEAMSIQPLPRAAIGEADIVLGERGLKSQLPRSGERPLIAHHGEASVGLLLSPDRTVSYGVALLDGVMHRLVADAKDPALLRAVALADLYPELPEISTSCGVEDFPVTEPLPPLSGLAARWKRGDAEKVVGNPVAATIAVDLDEELMASRFSNNATTAQQWLDQLFVAMNVMFTRDLQVTLVRGTTILRNSGNVAADPYSATSNPNMLFEFGEVWRLNHAAVDRAFAVFASGKHPNQNAGSGLAWINLYCNDGFVAPVNGQDRTIGSFQASLVIRNPVFGAEVNAPLIAHEIGHNMGAQHTHCTNRNADPNNFDPIDRCNNTEIQPSTQCWTGTLACPIDFGGRGTLMSYCEGSAAGCQPNVFEMHPIHIDILNARIAANTPACLTPTSVDNADLSVTASINKDPAPVGDVLTYTVNTQNGGPNAATSVQLVLSLPSGVTGASASGPGYSCAAPAGGSITCTRASFNQGSSAAVTATMTLPLAYAGAATLNFQATLSSSVEDGDSGNNSATVVTPVDFIAPFRIFGGPVNGSFESP